MFIIDADKESMFVPKVCKVKINPNLRKTITLRGTSTKCKLSAYNIKVKTEERGKKQDKRGNRLVN